MIFKKPNISDRINSLEFSQQLLDERLTSVQAEKLLINSNVRREKRKQVIDKLSATIILQDYLSSI